MCCACLYCGSVGTEFKWRQDWANCFLCVTDFLWRCWNKIVSSLDIYQLDPDHCWPVPIFSASLSRGRPHLCPLFVNLWPVGLQSDDSVEFVQCQVSILYILPWQQSKKRQLHFSWHKPCYIQKRLGTEPNFQRGKKETPPTPPNLLFAFFLFLESCPIAAEFCQIEFALSDTLSHTALT